MWGVSIDDRPDAPVGTPDFRRTVAIHWHWTTEYTDEEIGQALGVTSETIRRYLRDGPGKEVEAQLADVEAEVRLIAIRELKEQLQAAGHRSRTAETPAKVWTDENGDLNVKDVTDEDGELVKKVPVPEDLDLLPDEEARYYARAEVRDILEQLTELLGVGEPEQIEMTGEGGGPLDVTIRREVVDGGE